MERQEQSPTLAVPSTSRPEWSRPADLLGQGQSVRRGQECVDERLPKGNLQQCCFRSGKGLSPCVGWTGTPKTSEQRVVPDQLCNGHGMNECYWTAAIENHDAVIHSPHHVVPCTRT